MDIDRRKPLETRLQSLDERLPDQIVQSHISLSLFAMEERNGEYKLSCRGEGKGDTYDNKEMGLAGMESDLLDLALGLFKRRLGLVLGHLMDEYRHVGT